MRLQAQPTRFYTDINQQNRYKAQCEGDCIVAPIVPCNYLPFFVVERGESEYFDIVRFESKCLDGSDVQVHGTGRFNACTYDCVDYIVHDPEFVDPCMNCGLRYFEFEDDTGRIWYSDLFEVKDFNFGDNDFYSMSWKNSVPLNNVDYGDFRFYYWFAEDANIGVPEYRKKVEGKENGFGKEKRVFELLEKFYLVDTSNIPEFIVDAIEFASMNDQVQLTIANGETVDIDKLETSVEWLEEGCYANTTIRFIIESCIVDDGCGDKKDECLDDNATDILQGLDSLSQSTIESGVLTDGDTYFVLSDDFTAGNSWSNNVGSLAIWNDNNQEWNFKERVDGEYFYATVNNFFFCRINGEGQRVFIINSATDAGGGSANLQAVIPEKTWGQVLVSAGGPYTLLPDIYTAYQFEAGITVGPFLTPQTYTFRLFIYNHNCSYPDQQIPSTSQSVLLS